MLKVKDIAKTLAPLVGSPERHVKKILDAAVKEIKRTLVSGGEVELYGLMKLYVTTSSACANPKEQTGRKVYRRLHARFSKKLRDEASKKI